MYVCMYVCMYVYVCMCMCACAHVCDSPDNDVEFFGYMELTNCHLLYYQY